MTTASGQPLHVARNDPSFCAANATVTLLALRGGGNTSIGFDRAVFMSSAAKLAQTA
jgi:hypothetical protein